GLFREHGYRAKALSCQLLALRAARTTEEQTARSLSPMSRQPRAAVILLHRIARRARCGLKRLVESGSCTGPRAKARLDNPAPRLARGLSGEMTGGLVGGGAPAPRPRRG